LIIYKQNFASAHHMASFLFLPESINMYLSGSYSSFLRAKLNYGAYHYMT